MSESPFDADLGVTRNSLWLVNTAIFIALGLYVLCVSAAAAFPQPLILVSIGFVTGTIAVAFVDRSYFSRLGFSLAWIIWGLGTFLILLPVLSGPMCIRPASLDRLYQCGGNLRQLGDSMIAYAAAHDGHFPPNAMVLLQYMVSSGKPFSQAAQCFVCPETKDTPAKVLDDLTVGGHFSYIYVANGLLTSCSPDSVLIYEPLTNHGPNNPSDVANILYADGHVDMDNRQYVEKIVRRLDAGENPPGLPSDPPVTNSEPVKSP